MKSTSACRRPFSGVNERFVNNLTGVVDSLADNLFVSTHRSVVIPLIQFNQKI